jgi:hypothetical protein
MIALEGGHSNQQLPDLTAAVFEPGRGASLCNLEHLIGTRDEPEAESLDAENNQINQSKLTTNI